MTEPTIQDAQELLKQLGISSGQWGNTPDRTIRLPVVDKQSEALLKLRALLENLVESDRQTMLQLREQLNRLQHGGGS